MGDRSIREVFEECATPEEREAYENARPDPNLMYHIEDKVVRRVGAREEVMRRAHRDGDLLPKP